MEEKKEAVFIIRSVCVCKCHSVGGGLCMNVCLGRRLGIDLSDGERNVVVEFCHYT